MAWTAAELASRQLSASHCKDFQNGLLLANLLEILTDKSLIRRYKFILRPISDDQKRSNLQECATFLRADDFQGDFENLPTSIFSGDERALSALLWQIFFTYRIFPLLPRHLRSLQTPLEKIFSMWLQRWNITLSAAEWPSGRSFCKILNIIDKSYSFNHVCSL